MALDPETLRRAAREKAARAMRHIENAQNELRSAQQELSALRGGATVWNRAGKMADACHAFWYRVQSFRDGGKYSLDPCATEALARRIGEAIEKDLDARRKAALVGQQRSELPMWSSDSGEPEGSNVSGIIRTTGA